MCKLWGYFQLTEVSSGGSRIFPRGGREPSRGGVNTPNFPENCMKSKEFGRPGGACVPHAPPRSANGLSLRTVTPIVNGSKQDVTFCNVNNNSRSCFWPFSNDIFLVSLEFTWTQLENIFQFSDFFMKVFTLLLIKQMQALKSYFYANAQRTKCRNIIYKTKNTEWIKCHG